MPDIDTWKNINFNIIDIIKQNDIVFLDGTFYKKSEVQSRDISKIPHPDITDTMSRLSGLSNKYRQRVHFIHLNHTNDVLREKSDAFNDVINQGFSLTKENQIFKI